MPYMFVKITLNDFNQWKAAWDSAEQVQIRTAYGCKSARVYQGYERTSEAVILMEWDDIGEAKDFGISDELRELMNHTGGSGSPDVLFLNDVT